MVEVGHIALLVAWAFSLFGFAGGLYAVWNGSRSLQFAAIRSVSVVAVLSFISLACLGKLFLAHDYRYAYIWQHSNNEMSAPYLISAIWGGMDGSMLLWAAMGAFFGAIALKRFATEEEGLSPYIAVVLSASTFFFLSVVSFFTNPFRFIPTGVVPDNGQGLNPLLQNPSMLIHPLCLYAGFTGFAVPFAVCIAALMSGKLSSRWLELTRFWTLVAWAFLTTGVILGGNWAYIELGWGGFWAWDPVENASFLPWLTATAFLHSQIVQQRRGMLKVWNVTLCALTYLLTVYGTFLTRSGVVQSVHAFAETDVGWVFLLYLGILVLSCIALIIWRLPLLRPENTFESYLSREGAFLFNNLIFVSICFATFWGVMHPVFSEALFGEKSVVGPPFFNRVNVPLFLILLFLLGAGPLISWKKTSWSSLSRLFALPLIMGSLVVALGLWLDAANPAAAIAFGLSAFVTVTILTEFHRAVRARREFRKENVVSSVVELVRRKPQRYGGYIVHLGVVVMAISITASMVYKIERDISLRPGERVQIGRFNLELEKLSESQERNFSVLHADVKVFEVSSGTLLGFLRPEQRFYPASQQTTSEVDIRVSPREDLYLAIGGLDTSEVAPVAQSRAVFKVFVNPLQVWLWFGGLIVLGGTLAIIAVAVAERVSERKRIPDAPEARVPV